MQASQTRICGSFSGEYANTVFALRMQYDVRSQMDVHHELPHEVVIKILSSFIRLYPKIYIACTNHIINKLF